MPSALATLLDKSEEEVAKTVGKLEQMAGHPSEDVRLLAESSQAVRAKLAQLGLDPDDTTGEELYHSLLARYQSDCAQVDRALGINNSSSFDEKVVKAAQLIGPATASTETWVIKNPVVKSLLKAQPPKKLMKLLKYRSVDSLLKREDPEELLLVATYIEPGSWQKALATKVNKLGSNSFELRVIKVIKLSAKKWSAVAPSDQLVAYNHLVGSLAIWPSALAQKASCLAYALFLADELQKSNPSVVNSILKSHPVLGFWQGAEYLLAWNNGQPVSLNLKDSCLNDLYQKQYGRHTTQHANQSLYAQLLERYKEQLEALPDEISGVGHNLENNLKLHVPALNELALAYYFI